MKPRSEWSEWAESLRRFKLDVVAAWLLEAGGPLTVLGAQAVYLGQPFLGGKKLDYLLRCLKKKKRHKHLPAIYAEKAHHDCPWFVDLYCDFLLIGGIFLRRRFPGAFRPIEAYERLNRAVGLAVESGTRLHISLGRGNLFTSRGASALAGLAMLRRLAERTSLSDRPPVVTSGDASLAILSQDTLQSGYRAAAAEDNIASARDD